MAGGMADAFTPTRGAVSAVRRSLSHHVLFFLAITLMAVATLFSGCAREKAGTMRVGANVWPGYEPLFLARSLGHYDNTGIKLVEYTSTTSVIRAYKNNLIEVAAVTMDEAFLLAEDGPAGYVILIADFSNGADAVVAREDIDSMRALKGKRVGVETTALGAYMLSRSLESAGLAPKDVIVAPVEHNKQEKAFKDGLVDAVVTFDPVREKLVNAGAKTLFDSSKLPGEIVDVLYIRRDVLEKNREAADALAAGWFRALGYLQKNPDDAARRISPRENLPPEEFLKSLKGLRFPGIKENMALLSGSDPSFLNAARVLAKVMKDKNLAEVDADPSTLVNQSIIRKMAP